jgi:hypothetical protein
MKVRLLLLLLQMMCLAANASTRLTEKERAAVFVIREEATDFALEAREDVCVEFGKDSSLRSTTIVAALREEGMKFHDGSWCNAHPRGVRLIVELQRSEQNPPSLYEFITQISDSDPIRYMASILRLFFARVDTESSARSSLQRSWILIRCCVAKRTHLTLEISLTEP